MAIKMRKAIIKETGEVKYANQIPETQKPDLICHSCHTDIRHVNRHPRELPSGSRTWVPAYFGLKSKGQHNEGCQYVPKHLVEKVIADSQLGANAEQIFNAKENGSADFRLHIPVEALKIIQRMTEADETKTTEDAFSGAKYVRNHQQLNAYLNTTNQLMALRALVEKERDLSEHVNIVMYGCKIPWRKFFYDEKRYPDLITHLVKSEQKRPVCLLMNGIKKKAYPVREGWKPAWSLTSYEKGTDPRDNVTRWLSISVKTKDQRLFDSINDGADIAVLFSPQLKEGFSESNGVQYVNISGNLHHKQQICIVS